MPREILKWNIRNAGSFSQPVIQHRSVKQLELQNNSRCGWNLASKHQFSSRNNINSTNCWQIICAFKQVKLKNIYITDFHKYSSIYLGVIGTLQKPQLILESFQFAISPLSRVSLPIIFFNLQFHFSFQFQLILWCVNPLVFTIFLFSLF